MVIVSMVAFGAMLTLLRSAINDINKDPSLATLTNEGVFNVVQIVNTNKNLNGDDCWNQKNPYKTCDESNKIASGTYIVQGGDDAIWLDGPQTNLFNKDLFALSEADIRNTLGGFMLANQTYFQKIIISYPNSPDSMNITVETQNSEKQSYSQSITINK